jgi:hypothetical protein
VSQNYKYTDVLVELLPWSSMYLKFLGHFDYSSLGRRELPIEEKIASAELMESARYYQATQPHDKVYAMYGLLQERHIPLAKPDYSQPVSEVFCDLARAIIESSKSLEILYQVHGCGPTADLPSWVPDWSGSTHPGRAPIGNCMGESYEEVFTFERGGKYLRVKGIKVDVISSRTENHPLRRTAENELIVPDPFWHSMLQKYGNDHGGIIRSLWNVKVYSEFCSFAVTDALSPEDSEPMDAFSQTLHYYNRQYGKDGMVIPYGNSERTRRWTQAITSSPPHPFSENLDEGENSESPDWLRGIVRQVQNEEVLRPIRYTREFQALKSVLQDAESIMEHDRIMRFNRHQVLFRTKANRLGMAPFSIQTGDEIVLVLGLRTPIVVRRQGHHYQLRAPAYVHGIMDGEALREGPGNNNFDDFIFV